MESSLVLSLCIPTNGVLEWINPVINSIYDGISDYRKFEVIVTDNGNDESFEKAMKTFSENHSNFRYYKTNAYMFLNQIEAFKLAKGQLIKFVNHRSMMRPGAVEYLISYAENNSVNKPVTYFSNGVLALGKSINRYASFDDFVSNLSYYSSWSGGTAMWKSDFEKFDLNAEFNHLFPHTDLIFFNKTSKEYIIDNSLIMKDIPADVTKKGKYDLFNAFAVEYPRIIENLMNEKYISQKTFESVIRKNREFVNRLYFDYIFRKLPCSYDLSGFEKSIGVYYSRRELCGNRVKNYIQAVIEALKSKGKRYISIIMAKEHKPAKSQLEKEEMNNEILPPEHKNT